MKYLFTHINPTCVLSIVLSFMSISAFSQSFHTDTIPWNSVYLKSGQQGIIETRAEINLTIAINEIVASNSGGLRDEFGEQDDWFELFNYGDEPVKLNGLYFSDDKDEPLKWKLISTTDTTLNPGEFMHIWADNSSGQGELHAGFKLSSEGEFVGVFSETGDLISGVSFPKQTTDISYGRFPDGGSNFHFFEKPTPSAPNDAGGVAGILSMPVSNQKGGFFSTTQTLKFSTNVTGASIRYTLDFSEPTDLSPLLKDSILIIETTIIRAATFKDGYANSQTLTVSFLFDENQYVNPAISLVGDDEHIFGNKGILVQTNQDIEIPVNFEFIKNGKALYSSGSGIHIHSPKAQKQYSLRLYARGVYGSNWFEFPFFDEKGPDKFKRLILRNAGNDNVQGKTLGTHFRDPLIHKLAKNTNVRPMVSESKPVNVFINGSFYGVYNLRERIDEYYIENHTGVTSNYDLLERAFGYKGNRNAIEGSFDKFSEQVNHLVSIPDKNDSLVFDSIKSMFDIENFRDYWITQVFVGNYDWLSNNVKYWCPEGGKWQWIYWDLDHGIGYPYQSYGLPKWNTLEWSLGFTDRAWSSGYNNRVIRNLLENETFKTNFIQRFTYLLSTHFAYKSTSILVDSMASEYRPDMPLHFNRWPGSGMENWEEAILKVHDYLLQRPEEVLEHIQSQFKLADPVEVNIEVSPAYFGEVKFSTGLVTDSLFSGKFFAAMNYELIAKPKQGFVFVGWEGVESNEAACTFALQSDTMIKALFIAETNAEPLVISEIFYNNHPYFDAGDWIELENTTDNAIDLSAFQLHIHDNAFVIPNTHSIPPKSKLILAAEKTNFKNIYKSEVPVLELKGLEIPEAFSIKLLSDNLELLDEVSNNNATNISALQRKNGYSLELKSIYLDNKNGNNWTLSANRFGSPGIDNDLEFHFSNPSSEDITIAVYETSPVIINISDFVLYDDDGHGLAGIQFSEMQNRNAFSINDELLELDKIYSIQNLVYEMDASKSEEQFTFFLVDSTVSFTEEHVLTIANAVGGLNTENTPSQVYPIPIKNQCTVVGLSSGGNSLSIKLWSISGRQVKAFHYTASQQVIQLNVSDIPNGTYLLSIEEDIKKSTIKVLIQR